MTAHVRVWFNHMQLEYLPSSFTFLLFWPRTCFVCSVVGCWLAAVWCLLFTLCLVICFALVLVLLASLLIIAFVCLGCFLPLFVLRSFAAASLAACFKAASPFLPKRYLRSLLKGGSYSSTCSTEAFAILALLFGLASSSSFSFGLTDLPLLPLVTLDPFGNSSLFVGLRPRFLGGHCTSGLIKRVFPNDSGCSTVSVFKFVFSADLSFSSSFVCLRFFPFSSFWEAQASLCTVKGVASFSLRSTTFAVSTGVVCSFVSAPFSSCFSSSFGTALKYSCLAVSAFAFASSRSALSASSHACPITGEVDTPGNIGCVSTLSSPKLIRICAYHTYCFVKRLEYNVWSSWFGPKKS